MTIPFLVEGEVGALGFIKDLELVVRLYFLSMVRGFVVGCGNLGAHILPGSFHILAAAETCLPGLFYTWREYLHLVYARRVL